MRLKVAIAAALALMIGTAAHAGPLSATVVLNGGNFIQDGSVTNNSDGGLNIVAFIYSLGTPGNGIATWDSSTGGGVASDQLSNPQFFQTVTWAGLNVAPGASFIFGGLDIDFITTLVPLVVTGAFIDNVGTSLANAFVRAVFSNGSTSEAELLQQGWTQSQTLALAPGTPAAVPEPATLLLIGTGVAALARRRRRQ